MNFIKNVLFLSEGAKLVSLLVPEQEATFLGVLAGAVPMVRVMTMFPLVKNSAQVLSVPLPVFVKEYVEGTRDDAHQYRDLLEAGFSSQQAVAKLVLQDLDSSMLLGLIYLANELKKYKKAVVVRPLELKAYFHEQGLAFCSSTVCKVLKRLSLAGFVEKLTPGNYLYVG